MRSIRVRRATVAIGVLLGILGVSHLVQAEDPDAFIERLAPMAQRVSAETQIPTSVILAVAAHESAWNRSYLSRKGHNFFGIKGSGSAGSLRLWTHEYIGGVKKRVKANFRAYKSPEDAFNDYADVLSHSRYRTAFHFTDDPHRFIRAVHSGGYATDPKYAQKISAIIRRYDLTQYDRTEWTRQEFVDGVARKLESLTGRTIAPTIARPDDPITRAEAARVFAAAFGIQPEPVASAPFSDVPADHPMAGILTALKERGLIAGTGSGRFNPDRVLKPRAGSDLIDRADDLQGTRRDLIEGMVDRLVETGRLSKEKAKEILGPPPAKTYTVQPGDTLAGISKRFYGTTQHWPELHKANRTTLLDPDELTIGQKLTIPATPGAGTGRTSPISRGEAARVLAEALDLKPSPGAATFDDLNGHPAKAQARAVHQAGLLEGEGTSYRPDVRLLATDIDEILNRLATSPNLTVNPEAAKGLNDVLNGL